MQIIKAIYKEQEHHGWGISGVLGYVIYPNTTRQEAIKLYKETYKEHYTTGKLEE
jgi:hypothetical protein